MQSNIFGSGDDYGSGDGDGCGCGDGYGYGGGYGCSSGYGDGYGDGYGCSSGDGYGEVVGRVGRYDVYLLTPWAYVRVGCETHGIAYWRDHWEEIAASEKIKVTTDDVQKIFAQITRAIGKCIQEILMGHTIENLADEQGVKPFNPDEALGVVPDLEVG